MITITKRLNVSVLILTMTWALFTYSSFTHANLANNETDFKKVERLLLFGNQDEAQKLLNNLQLKTVMLEEAQSGKEIGLKIAEFEARILFANNKLKQASNLLEELIEKHPNTPSLYKWYGQVNGGLAQQASIFKAGSYAKKSKNAFHKSIEVDTNYVDGYIGLIQFYLQAPAIAGGSNKKAKTIANQLLKVDPLQGTLSLLSVAQENNDQDRQEQLISQLEKDFQSSATALYVVGFHYQRQQRFEQAYQAFQSSVSSNVSDDVSTKELQSQLSSLYQLGRNAVFSSLHIKEGIQALTKYINVEVPTQLPSKSWANYRLAKLYLLDNQSQFAKPILMSLKAQLESDGKNSDKDLLALVKKELKKS